MTSDSRPVQKPPSPANEPKYWAFISYSSADKKTARWLIDALEGYRVPRGLVGRQTDHGPVPARLFPVFRDRDELRASSDLQTALEEALSSSRYLIVICSPNSARPESWVNQEVLTFKKMGRKNQVLALILNGEPHASEDPATADSECFPEALRYDVDEEGRITGQLVEPLAADLTREDDRPRIARRKALLKLIARMIGVDFDDLWQRDRQRRRRRFAAAGVSALVVLTLFLALARIGLNAGRSEVSARLAEQATASLNETPDLALLLSVAAYRTAPTPSSYGALLTTVEETSHLITYLREPQGTVTALAIRPDGQQVAVARCISSPCTESRIFLYDPDDPAAGSQPLPLEIGRVSRLLYEPKTEQLLTVTSDEDSWRLIRIDEQTSPPNPEQLFRTLERIRSVAWARDTSFYAVAVGSDRQGQNEYKLFEDQKGRRCGGFSESPVQTLTISPAGDRLAVGGEFGSIILLDSSGCRSQTLHHSRLADLAFDSTGRYLTAIMPDGTLTQWDLQEGRKQESFHLTGSMLNGFLHRFSPMARYLASQDGNRILVYDLEERRQVLERLNAPEAPGLVERTELQKELEQLQVARLAGHQSEPTLLQFELGGEMLASSDAQGEVILWSTKGTPLVEELAIEETTEASNLADHALNPEGPVEAQISEEQEGCTGDYKLDCKRTLKLSLRSSATGEAIRTLETVQEGLSGVLPVSSFELTFQPGGEVLTRGFSEDGILLTHHRWNIAPQHLLERACKRAHRPLREEDVKRFIQGWRALLVAEACPPGRK